MSATTAIAPANQWTGLGIEGFEDLGQNDVILPRWSIVQPTARMEGAKRHIGEFVRNLDGEFRPSLDVVLLKVSPNRILWPAGEFRADRKPECTSHDGITGSVYGACGSCQFNAQVNRALWDDRGAKVCSFGYSVVMVDDVEAGTLALFGAMTTSVRPMKVLTTQFIQRKRPAFSALVRLETVETTNDRGSYFVLKPTIVQWFDPAEVEVWRETFQSVAGSVVRDYEEAGEGETAEVPF